MGASNVIVPAGLSGGGYSWAKSSFTVQIVSTWIQFFIGTVFQQTDNKNLLVNVIQVQYPFELKPPKKLLQNTTFDNEGNVVIREDNYLFKCSHTEMMKLWRYLYFDNGSKNDHPVRSYFASLPPEKQKTVIISNLT